MTPATDLTRIGTRIDGPEWRSEPNRALQITVAGEVEVVITADSEAIATLRIASDELRLDRHEDVVDAYAQTYLTSVTATGKHSIVITTAPSKSSPPTAPRP